jgi:hypothetical protein
VFLFNIELRFGDGNLISDSNSAILSCYEPQSNLTSS